MLGFAERKGWLPVNVARHVELPGKPESAEIRFLEPLEVRALADAAVDGPYRESDRAMYLTAAMTGLRQGELVALRWCDVGLDRQPNQGSPELRVGRVRHAEVSSLDTKHSDGR